MSTTDTTSTPASPAPTGGDIVARPGTYYRRARYVMSLLMVLGGAYFLYDGYMGYPQHNQELATLKREIGDADGAGDKDKAAALNVKLSKMHKEYSEDDIRLQRKLGYALPPIGLALLCWTLYRSRGVYRLTGKILGVPGHPPITISEVTEIDNTLWQRKGIANIKYTTADGKSGAFKLDDFVYERKPIDAIYDRILAHHQPATPSPAAATSDSDDA